MPKFSAYLSALQPRRVWWFVSILSSVAYLGLGYFLLPDFDPGPRLFKVVVMIAAYLLFGVIVILVSGFVAWGKLQEKYEASQARWYGLDRERRRQLTDLLRGLPAYPEVLIRVNDTPDCKTLAADLFDAITDAGIQIPMAPIVREHDNWLPSGVVIFARPGDARTAALQKGLKTACGIDAHIDERSHDSMPHLLIGCRI